MKHLWCVTSCPREGAARQKVNKLVTKTFHNTTPFTLKPHLLEKMKAVLIFNEATEIAFYSVDDEFTTHLLRRLHVMGAMKNEQVIQN